MKIEAVIAHEEGRPKCFPGIYSIHNMTVCGRNIYHLYPLIKYSLRILYSRLLISLLGGINPSWNESKSPKPYLYALLTTGI